MPSPAEGLTFGDFTAEEWEKFFKRPAAQFGNSPPVEFLFEFEYSDNEEPNHYDGSVGQKLCDESSSAARNVAAGPEDSGVEVGQESEQEITPAKPAKQPTGGVKIDDQSKLENAYDDLPQAEPKQDVAEPSSHPVGQGSGPQQIVFAGNSIVKETDPAKKSASAPSSPESDSFPPLQSTVMSQIDKQAEIKPENERSRKRRKRRKQRKRSGSVSSSSSECSEKERGSLNAVNAKGKTSAGMLLASEKEAVKVETPSTLDKEQQKDRNTSTDERKALQRQDTSSGGDGQVKRKSSSSTGDISNSPTHSDTDAKITVTVTVNNVQLDCKPVQGQTETVELTASEQSTKPSSAAKEAAIKKEPPKPCSWADLFKNSPKPSPGIVIKVGSAAAKVETKVLSGPKKTEEPAQTTVKVQEDKHAKRLAEIIQKVELNYLQKPFIPRGLTNRGNWCYVNATLQALAGCPPFFNLLRELPLIKDRGPTSTPILDSLTSFMNEFKNPPPKPGANSGMPSKAELNPGESWEPSNVYKMLSVIQSSLSAKGRQEDAQEFLSCVLNGMHEEMLQLSKIVSSPAKAVPEQQTDREVLPETEDPVVNGEGEGEDDGDWEQVGPRNKSMVTRMASYPQSLISNMFGGYLRSSVHQTGLKDSANVEPFFELHLDVQTVTSVEEALKNLVLKEEVQVDISRRVTLEELPKVLILHLKRFIYSKSGSQKLQKVIDYPLELTIGKELLSPNVRNKYPASQKTYKLFAVVYHHGKNAWGGHYTTDVLQPVHGWVRADDTRLKVVPMNYVLKPTQGKDPYVLFYRRTDLMP